MRVLDLFSGLGGWGAAFRDRGHDVTSIDYEPRFGSSLVVSVMDIKALNGWDVILASPPCECFSVMTIGKYWNKDRTPKTEKSERALALARHTFDLIERAKPSFYIVENPRGMLRKLSPQPPTATVWYCRYGSSSAKPTDLWTNLNGGGAIGWLACASGAPDHDAAPRGADAGTQRRRPDGRIDTRYLRDAATRGKDRAAERALIPYRLSLTVALACERWGVLPAIEEVIALEAALRGKAA